MLAHFVCLFGTLVGAHATTSGSLHEARRLSKRYSIQDQYTGSDIMDNWIYFTGSDPTGGNVNYVNQTVAEDDGLVYLDSNGYFVSQVDYWSSVSSGGNRNSVRVSSPGTYNSGLFILDASRMPQGCAVWPAFWTTGANWPDNGEIDIVEGVNNQEYNQMTLHSGTSNACTIDTSNESAFTGTVLSTNCYSTATSDSGCSIDDSSSTSFAAGFNDANGGVFAMLWDTSNGISIWHFARDSIPSDITNQDPTPTNWGKPSGFWSATTCDIADNFKDHTITIDTTICGDWAGGSAYSNSGCPGTCSDMVANATNFNAAQWVIRSIVIYQ